MKNYKNKTNEKLLKYYNENGKDSTIAVARTMLEVNTHKDDKLFRAHLHGEICETVAQIIIIDFMKKHPEETKDWILSKGMILKDIENPNNGYLTEIDLTLFTNYQILTLECKSYGGDKTFKGACIVNRVGQKSVDVFDQHEKHYECLLKTFERFKEYGNGAIHVSPIKLGYFDFSIGKVIDKRTNYWKNRMPIFNEHSLEKQLNDYLNRPNYWKMDYVRKVVDTIDKNKKNNTAKHLKYVTGLKHK